MNTPEASTSAADLVILRIGFYTVDLIGRESEARSRGDTGIDLTQARGRSLKN
jgi:hypothetical protein